MSGPQPMTDQPSYITEKTNLPLSMVTLLVSGAMMIGGSIAYLNSRVLTLESDDQDQKVLLKEIREENAEIKNNLRWLGYISCVSDDKARIEACNNPAMPK